MRIQTRPILAFEAHLAFMMESRFLITHGRIVRKGNYPNSSIVNVRSDFELKLFLFSPALNWGVHMLRHQKAPRWNGGGSARNAVCSFPERRFDESFPVELSGKEQEERRKRNRGRRKRGIRMSGPRSEAGCAG